MAYFIPSYFQKRLLRYALSRLDLIETDDLDLDNLGLTFGQRSVIELKSVAIQVKKLSETLPLPSFVTVNRASIRLLRLTIPADLHVSGIEVDVDGVDVDARVITEEQEDVSKTTQERVTSKPSRTNRANRPRISSPPVHDPGGIPGAYDNGAFLELSQVIPSSQDLAMSFLESEPLEERQELEAAIESHAQHMQESSMTSSFGGDSGLGMPDGLTLPGFVANFFKGVADRLSVKVSNVAVSVTMETPAASVIDNDRITFVLKVAAFNFEGFKDQGDPGLTYEMSRRIEAQGIDIGILADRGSLSITSSPTAARSQMKSSSLNSSSLPQSGTVSPASTENHGSGSETFRTFSELETVDALSESQSNVGLGINRSPDQSMTLSSSMQAEEFAAATAETPSEPLNTFPIDNRAHAEQLTGSGAISRVNTSGSTRPDVEGLSESKLFTHEEAESMYLSAISNDLGVASIRGGMPGAWDWSHAVQELDAEPSTVEAPPLETSTTDKSILRELPVEEQLSSTPPPSTPTRVAPLTTPLSSSETSGICFIRVARLDSVRVTVPRLSEQMTEAPSSPPGLMSDEGRAQSVPSPQRHTAPRSSRGSSFRNTPSHTSQVRDKEQIEKHRMKENEEGANSPILLDLGSLTLVVDMNICTKFIRAGQALFSKAIPAPTTKQSQFPQKSPVARVKMQMHRFQLRFCETISRHSEALYVSASEVLQPSDDPLLTFSILGISYATERRQLSISKVSVQHSSREVLGFVDSVNVRDSLSSSSILRPHDLVIAFSGTRVEAQVKPIHIVLDLPLLDDVLSRSGGLSSLLDLGSSITSNSTVKAPAPKSYTSAPASRTVRFDAPDTRPRSDSDPSAGNKINVRVSGCIIDLVGSEASIQVKSTAIKIAHRQENLRVVIDGAAVEGPLFPNSRSAPPISARMKSIELYYSESPTETDLDRLLSLLTPSSNKYDKDDDIMVDRLLRQRRKGGVLRFTLGELQLGTKGVAWRTHLAKLSEELAKLSTVTKYLPEDDRPGILTFALINKLDFRFQLDEIFGFVNLKAELLEGAHISIPSLAAAQISSWVLTRGDKDVLIGEVIPQKNAVMGPPMLMCRFIADEMDPTVRLKLTNTCLEYRVSTLIAITDLIDRFKATETSRPTTQSFQSSPTSSTISDASNFARKIKLSLALRDSAAALYPLGSPAKGLFLLTDAVIGHSSQKRQSVATVDLKKASLLVIDDADSIGRELGNVNHKIYFDQNDQVQHLAQNGFVPVGSISSASAIIKIIQDKVINEQQIDVEFRNNLLFLETCADSTQTLVQILSGLAPPSPPSPIAKYRTQIVPIQDMIASFTGNAFVSEPGPDVGLQASFATVNSAAEEREEEEDGGFMNDFYQEDVEADDDMTASYVESDLAQSAASSSLHIAPVDMNAPNPADLGQSMMAHSMLDFRTDHFAAKSSVGGTAHRWDSTKNTYGLGSDAHFQKSPLKVRIRDVHFIWNLFDGYDWRATRDTISQAVKEIENKAMTRRPRSGSRLSPGTEDDDESVIGDFLFNSIYIGISANKDPRELANAINHDIDDLASETGSYATGTTATASPTRHAPVPRGRSRKLKLNRSKHHKMTFELEGVSADIVAFSPGSGEVESSVDVRVRKLEIFDHVPTSTWKKFATYMQDAGEREVDTNMVHLELLNVKPIAELSASEIVLKVTVLPLRLHVDQDALDFMTRFFEFKDDRVPVSTAPSNPPFLQRVEVNPVQVKLDFKPKRVDYGGLRSGRTTEFMNFIVLDRADMVLRRVILYGVSGFDRLGIMLNNIWMPDVKRNQLAGIMAGLAPIRPLVDVGSGVRDLIAVPIREYRKDGRVVRSIQKGAIAFAKTTATELVNLGAKLAIGTQQVLQNAEGMLVETEQDDDIDEDSKKQISLYADQPLGIVQGLRTAYASLERDLLLAKDAIVAVPGEVMESGSATGAAKAILKQSPVIILRPAIGASKAIGTTLLGAGNTLDKHNLRRVSDKYKKH